MGSRRERRPFLPSPGTQALSTSLEPPTPGPSSRQTWAPPASPHWQSFASLSERWVRGSSGGWCDLLTCILGHGAGRSGARQAAARAGGGWGDTQEGGVGGLHLKQMPPPMSTWGGCHVSCSRLVIFKIPHVLAEGTASPGAWSRLDFGVSSPRG